MNIMGQHIDRKDIALFQLTFINAKEVLPKESGEYIVIGEYTGLGTIYYSDKYKKFNVMDTDKDDKTAIEILAWALPTKKLLDFVKYLHDNKKFIKV